MLIKKCLFALALILCMGAFSFQTFASTGEPQEQLSVSAAWIRGDTLHIEVTETETSESQTLEIDIKELAVDREIITIQAVDFEGNKSNIIEIKNPYFEAASVNKEPTKEQPLNTEKPDQNPFTPDGSGSVVDNATGSDEKEFFTIKTDNDNTFYLIIDKQRNADNVYLLNSVTEGDLMALAEKGESAGIPTPAPPPEPTPLPSEREPPEEEPPKETKSNGNSNIFIIIIIALAVGGVGYYFKIYKPKHDENDVDSDIDDDENDDFLDEDSYFLDDDELGEYEDIESEETDEKKGGDDE